MLRAFLSGLVLVGASLPSSAHAFPDFIDSASAGARSDVLDLSLPEDGALADLTTDDVQAMAACYLATHFWPQRSERLADPRVVRAGAGTTWSGRGLRDETGFVSDQWEKLEVRFDFSQFDRNERYYAGQDVIPFTIDVDFFVFDREYFGLPVVSWLTPAPDDEDYGAVEVGGLPALEEYKTQRRDCFQQFVFWGRLGGACNRNRRAGGHVFYRFHNTYCSAIRDEIRSYWRAANRAR